MEQPEKPIEFTEIFDTRKLVEADVTTASSVLAAQDYLNGEIEGLNYWIESLESKLSPVLRKAKPELETPTASQISVENTASDVQASVWASINEIYKAALRLRDLFNSIDL